MAPLLKKFPTITKKARQLHPNQAAKWLAHLQTISTIIST